MHVFQVALVLAAAVLIGRPIEFSAALEEECLRKAEQMLRETGTPQPIGELRELVRANGLDGLRFWDLQGASEQQHTARIEAAFGRLAELDSYREACDDYEESILEQLDCPITEATLEQSRAHARLLGEGSAVAEYNLNLMACLMIEE